jgi:hypothetical protein
MTWVYYVNDSLLRTGKFSDFIPLYFKPTLHCHFFRHPIYVSLLFFSILKVTIYILSDIFRAHFMVFCSLPFQWCLYRYNKIILPSSVKFLTNFTSTNLIFFCKCIVHSTRTERISWLSSSKWINITLFSYNGNRVLRIKNNHLGKIIEYYFLLKKTSKRT